MRIPWIISSKSKSVFRIHYPERLFHSFVWGRPLLRLPWLSVGNRSTRMEGSSSQTQTPRVILFNPCVASPEPQRPSRFILLEIDAECSRCQVGLPGKWESPPSTSWSELKNDKWICRSDVDAGGGQIPLTVRWTHQSPLQNLKSWTGEKKMLIWWQEISNFF